MENDAWKITGMNNSGKKKLHGNYHKNIYYICPEKEETTMAKIYKAEDIFKPLTNEQKKVADQNFRRAGSLKGKIKVAKGDVFNLKANW